MLDVNTNDIAHLKLRYNPVAIVVTEYTSSSVWISHHKPKQAVHVATQYASAPASWQYLRIYSPGGTCSGMLAIEDISNKLTFDLLTLKVVSESRAMWATSVPISVFLGLSVLKLGPMYVTDRQTDIRQKHRLWGRRHNNNNHRGQNLCSAWETITQNTTKLLLGNRWRWCLPNMLYMKIKEY